MDQHALIARGFVGVGVFEFLFSHFEYYAWHGIVRVASELEVAMVGGAAFGDEVLVLDFDLNETIAN